MSGPSPRTYSFDWLFFRRLFRLHKIFFPAFLSANVCLFVLLILTSISGLKLSSCIDVNVVQSSPVSRVSSSLVRIEKLRRLIVLVYRRSKFESLGHQNNTSLTRLVCCQDYSTRCWVTKTWTSSKLPACTVCSSLLEWWSPSRPGFTAAKFS